MAGQATSGLQALLWLSLDPKWQCVGNAGQQYVTGLGVLGGLRLVGTVEPPLGHLSFGNRI